MDLLFPGREILMPYYFTKSRAWLNLAVSSKNEQTPMPHCYHHSLPQKEDTVLQMHLEHSRCLPPKQLSAAGVRGPWYIVRPRVAQERRSISRCGRELTMLICDS